MTQAALSGDYVDLRFVKSRKVCQVVIEIPIEQGSAFVQAFGTPNPETSVPVAIARLQDQPEAQKANRPKRQWHELARAQQAGMACEDPEFRLFLSRNDRGVGVALVHAAEIVREICGVQSRVDLNTDRTAADKWDKLYSDFQLWRRGAA